MDHPVFIRLTTIPPQGTESVTTFVNLRNIRAVTAKDDCSVVETSADSVGTVRVEETWDDIGNQVQRGGVLSLNEEEST